MFDFLYPLDIKTRVLRGLVHLTISTAEKASEISGVSLLERSVVVAEHYNHYHIIIIAARPQRCSEPLSSTAPPTPEENALEGPAEVSVEDGVDDGVERRVAVADPEEDGEDEHGDAAHAEGRGDVEDEEGQPAQNERRHHQAQHQRRATLSGFRQLALVTLRREKVRGFRGGGLFPAARFLVSLLLRLGFVLRPYLAVVVGKQLPP